MLSPSDYNSAVPQFTNGNYAANPINPLYIEEPGSTDYNRGVEPLQTLPAQWWNWFANQFTLRFNKLNIYVKNIFNELAQLLSLMNITPDGTEGTPTIAQLKGAFQTEYPKYLALLMYPVGSLYWTGKAPDDGGDPNTLFGGTWVQIKGKFIFAKGDSDTLNDTGGSKTVTLTTQQIPSHTHTFHGSSATTGTESRSHTHTGSSSHSHNFGAYNDSGYMGASSKLSSGYNESPIYTLNFFRGTSASYVTPSVGRDAYGIDIQSATVSITTGNASQTHTHDVTANGYNDSTGGGQEHDNMPPYVVKYCWERTA